MVAAGPGGGQRRYWYQPAATLHAMFIAGRRLAVPLWLVDTGAVQTRSGDTRTAAQGASAHPDPDAAAAARAAGAVPTCYDALRSFRGATLHRGTCTCCADTTQPLAQSAEAWLVLRDPGAFGRLLQLPVARAVAATAARFIARRDLIRTG